MIPYVRSTYTSTAIDTRDAVYRCGACSVESPAIVSAISTSSSDTVFWIGGKAAAASAEADAVAGLDLAEQRVLGLAGCPACGVREPKQRTWAIAGAVAHGLFAWSWLTIPLVLLAVTGVIYAVQQRTLTAIGYGAAMLGAFSLVVGLLARFKYRRTTRDAEMLVVWMDA